MRELCSFYFTLKNKPTGHLLSLKVIHNLEAGILPATNRVNKEQDHAHRSTCQ